ERYQPEMKQYLGESSSTALIISQRPPNYTADRRERSPPGQPEHHSRSQAKLAGWQPRPHEALRDPLMPRRKLQHSGITARRGLWEVHYDPYDASHVFIGTPDGWVTAPWTHLPMISAPFAEFTWRHERQLAAAKDIPGA